MRAILIPVKEFSAAKKRLAPHLSPEARAALAQAFCADFFDMIARVRGVDAVFVVSKEAYALDHARALGWQTIVENEQISESRSVDTASQFCAEQGVTALLRLPVDIPLAEPDDIEITLESVETAPMAVIVPSAEGTGTNALLRAPPTLFPSHFGPGSFAKHLTEAERCGAALRVIRNPRIAYDIDDVGDLQHLGNRARKGSALEQWLAVFGPGKAEDSE